jgi:regulator of replication initiation timing
MGRGKRNAKEAHLESPNTSSSMNDTQRVLSAIENSLLVVTEKFDKQEETIKQLTQHNIALVTDITELKKNQEYFLTENDFLKSEVNDLQQEKLNSEVVISNLPINDQISAEETVEKILQTFGVNKEEVSGLFSVVKKKYNGLGKIHNIFLKFKSPESQINFLSAKKRKGPLLYQQIFATNQIHQSHHTNEIYINERLTNYNLELLREARRIQKKSSLSLRGIREAAF